jgi:hypothetical protein
MANYCMYVSKGNSMSGEGRVPDKVNMAGFREAVF